MTHYLDNLLTIHLPLPGFNIRQTCLDCGIGQRATVQPRSHHEIRLRSSSHGRTPRQVQGERHHQMFPFVGRGAPVGCMLQRFGCRNTSSLPPLMKEGQRRHKGTRVAHSVYLLLGNSSATFCLVFSTTSPSSCFFTSFHDRSVVSGQLLVVQCRARTRLTCHVDRIMVGIPQIIVLIPAK